MDAGCTTLDAKVGASKRATQNTYVTRTGKTSYWDNEGMGNGVCKPVHQTKGKLI